MQVKMYPQSGAATTIEVPASVIKTKIVPTLLHQVVVAEAANARAPHGHSKSRSEVSGGGHKPWRQKGTGRARASSNRSPLWPGGGISFGPKSNQNFSKDVNRTMRARAFEMALASKLATGAVVAIESWNLAAPKTKELVKHIAHVPTVGRRTLVLMRDVEPNLLLAARNIAGLELATVASASVTAIVNADRIIADKPALAALFARVSGQEQPIQPSKPAKQASTEAAETKEQA